MANNHKNSSTREAAERLADIIEKHLESLPESERATKRQAFHQVVSNVVATRAKRAKPPRTRVTRLSARRSG